MPKIDAKVLGEVPILNLEVPNRNSTFRKRVWGRTNMSVIAHKRAETNGEIILRRLRRNSTKVPWTCSVAGARLALK